MTNAQLRSHIEKFIARWTPLLGLEGWNIAVFFDETKEMAWCNAKPAYLEGEVHFNLSRIRKELRFIQDVEFLVVHELLHCIVWKASERAVAQLELSVFRVRDLARAGKL